jgi:hypothetical protein
MHALYLKRWGGFSAGKGGLDLDELVDAINHGLHKLHLGLAKTLLHTCIINANVIKYVV